MHGLDKTTSGFGKRNAAILELYFRFRVWHVCMCVVIGMSFCIHLPNFVAIQWLRRSYDVISILQDGGFGFRNGTRLRRWISICLPNFDEISQSTAKIKLLPFSEKNTAAILEETSGFDFDTFIVIGKSFCISLSHFVAIGLSAAKLWHYIDFSRWRPYSRKSTSGFGFGDGTRLGRWKSTGVPNIDEISQSTAEI